MPWTFAHPAAVIPLARYCPAPLNFPGLVIGSMTPDLGYHLLRKDFAAYAHTLEGSLLVCLPAGLLLLAFLCFARRPFWYLLPQPHREAFAPMATAKLALGPGALLAAGASVVLGAWTHILWDALTHNDGWIVLRVLALQEPLFTVGGVDLYLYNFLQHLSTALGVTVLAAVYWRWLSRTPAFRSSHFRRDDAWRYLVLAAFAVAAVAIALVVAFEAAERYRGFIAWRVFVFRSAVDGMSAFIALYLLGAVICYRARRAASP